MPIKSNRTTGAYADMTAPPAHTGMAVDNVISNIGIYRYFDFDLIRKFASFRLSNTKRQ